MKNSKLYKLTSGYWINPQYILKMYLLLAYYKKYVSLSYLLIIIKNVKRIYTSLNKNITCQ